eukprot:6847118-Prymnesium_polylepis.1
MTHARRQTSTRAAQGSLQVSTSDWEAMGGLLRLQSRAVSMDVFTYQGDQETFTTLIHSTGTTS